jgi:hypothetical protein
VERELSKIDKTISEYLAALEQGDQEEGGEEGPSAEALASALEQLRQRKVKFEELKTSVESEGEVSTVDPDARLMHSGGDARPLDVCYNVQTIVDDKHHLIVDFDIADRSDDNGNLLNMGQKAKEVMGVEGFTCLADKGYYDGQDIAACEENGITCLVAKAKAGGAKKGEGFTRERFIYDRESDSYICPCKNQLKFMRMHKHSNGKEYRLYANYSACGTCQRRAECTKSDKRELLRLPYQDRLDLVDEWTRKNKALYRRRQEIAEHPFGTVKAVGIQAISVPYQAQDNRRGIACVSGV